MNIRSIVTEATHASEAGRMSFPQVLAALQGAGVEGYLCDLRRGAKTYYLPGGEVIDIAAAKRATPVAERFDAETVSDAVRKSQRNEHSYLAFCDMVMAAGCAGYLVSLPGRRVVYYGRTGEACVEHFPI